MKLHGWMPSQSRCGNLQQPSGIRSLSDRFRKARRSSISVAGPAPMHVSGRYLVGPVGRVIGVDVTPAMVEKARANATLAGLPNVEILEADLADIPIPEGSADVVISNGAINLSPRKVCVMKEAARVLKPGGRLYI